MCGNTCTAASVQPDPTRGPGGATVSGCARRVPGVHGGGRPRIQRVTPGMDHLQHTIPTTEWWLHLTGQVVDVAKYTSFLGGSDNPTPLVLLGEAG